MDDSSKHDGQHSSTVDSDWQEASPSTSKISPAKPDGKDTEGSSAASQFHLLYSKSKVYVHPTPYTRDNIAGYVALLRKGPPVPKADGSNIYLAYMPEALLEQRDELDAFVSVERTADGGIESTIRKDEESVLISAPPPFSQPGSTASGDALYALSFPLSQLYSFTLSPPTFSNWYGTMVFSLIDGTALPTLHFHDDESQSTILGLQRAKEESKQIMHGDAASARSNGSASSGGQGLNAPPRASNGGANSPTPPCTWGGDGLLQQLRRYAHVLRSVLQSNLYLVNPSAADIETHTTPIFDDDAIDAPPSIHSAGGGGGGSAGSSGIQAQLPSAHRNGGGVYPLATAGNPADDGKMDPLTMWAKSTRMSFLTSFSHITKSARQATQQVLSHPLAKPYLGHLPGPVQTFAQAGPIPLGPVSDAEWGRIAQHSGVGEYDSARVYLAKWARLVAEEGERNKRNEFGLGVDGAGGADGTVGADGEPREEHGQLGVFELLAKSADVPRPPTTRMQGSPIALDEWKSLFDTQSGKPLHSEASIKSRIFAAGLADLETRREAWPFLLSVVPWDSTAQERETIWKAKEKQYWEAKKQWMNDPVLLQREDVLEQRHRIRVDCLRTDRGHPMFRAAEKPRAKDGSSGGSLAAATSPAFMSASIVQEKEAGHSGATSNDHVVRLGEILLTFGMWEAQTGKLGGYVQGMSDLASLLYIVCDGDEVRTFWCFVGLMQRMAPNFYADQSGMKRQLLLLQKLIAVMDPALYAHLDKADSLNLFFCFRWLLICFKREFPLHDLFKLWDCVWAAEFPESQKEVSKDGTPRDGISNSFSLFVALAVLESHRDSTMRYLDHFDELLQYMNGLSGHIDVETTIGQAQVLALALRTLFEQKDSAASDTAEGLTAIHARLGDDSEELRALVM